LGVALVVPVWPRSPRDDVYGDVVVARCEWKGGRRVVQMYRKQGTIALRQLSAIARDMRTVLQRGPLGVVGKNGGCRRF